MKVDLWIFAGDGPPRYVKVATVSMDVARFRNEHASFELMDVL